VSFEGLVKGHGKEAGNGNDTDLKKKDVGGFISGVTTREAFYADKATAKTAAAKWDPDADQDTWINEPVHSGAVFRRNLKSVNGDAMWELFSKNTGHLGVLDHPDQVDRLHGMHKFTGAAVRV